MRCRPGALPALCALLVPIPLQAQWCERDKLLASDADAGDEFGSTVAIAGDTVLAGSPQDDDAGPATGAVYAFDRSDAGTPSVPTDDGWKETAKILASDATAGFGFGTSVALSGTTALVGSPGHAGAGAAAGAAYVFERDDNGTPSDPTDDKWLETAVLFASDAMPGDSFGNAVALAQDTAIVGAWLDDGAGFDSGSAYVFVRDEQGTPLDPTDDKWVEIAKLAAGDGADQDRFGFSVSISPSNQTALVGATRHDNAALGLGFDSGAAYVFVRGDPGTPADPTDDSFKQQAKLNASDATSGDQFGSAVALPASDDMAVVGAWFENVVGINSGAAYVFIRDDAGTPADPSDDTYKETVKLFPTTAAQLDRFGGSIALSQAGDTILVGATGNPEAPLNPGSAVAFDRSDPGTPADPTDDTWPETMRLFAGDGAPMDELGVSVAIVPTGEVAALGAWMDDDAGPSTGAAYAFELDSVGPAAQVLPPYGCGFNPAGSLTVVSGLPVVGATFTMGVDNPLGTQAPGSLTCLSVATMPDPAFPCGTQVPGLGMAGTGAIGEILLALVPTPIMFPGPPWPGPGTPAVISVSVPDNCQLIGRRAYAQGVILDTTSGAPVPVGLTEGVELLIGN